MGKVLGLFIYLKARLREPSTFASLAAVMAIFGTHLDQGVVTDWINTLTLVFGGLGFFVKECPPETVVK
jgi:hypothetical protein